MPLLLYQILVYDMAITALAWMLEFTTVACEKPVPGKPCIAWNNWVDYAVGSLLFALAWPVRGYVLIASGCANQRWLRWLFASSRKPSWYPEFL